MDDHGIRKACHLVVVFMIGVLEHPPGQHRTMTLFLQKVTPFFRTPRSATTTLGLRARPEEGEQTAERLNGWSHGSVLPLLTTSTDYCVCVWLLPVSDDFWCAGRRVACRPPTGAVACQAVMCCSQPIGRSTSLQWDERASKQASKQANNGSGCWRCKDGGDPCLFPPIHSIEQIGSTECDEPLLLIAGGDGEKGLVLGRRKQGLEGQGEAKRSEWRKKMHMADSCWPR